MIIVDDLPTLPHPRSNSVVSHRPYGVSAIITGDEFISRICLETGNVIWFHERSRNLPPEAVQKLPRCIFVGEGNTQTLWVSDRHDVLAEIMAAGDGGLIVCAYSFKTGKPIWERHRPLPKAKAKGRKKSSQFYPLEFCAFIAADPERLIVCVLGGQLDVIRIDPSSGDVIYDKSHPDAHVGIVERSNFTGAWTRTSRLGIIDFETGENSILMEHSESFTRHIFHSGDRIIASWHSKLEFGIVWMKTDGTIQQQASFSRKKTNDTAIHLTSAGLALQVNDQKLLWFGDSNIPQWEALCKPYIYNVHGFPGTDIFVGTDGRGGRLFSFDQQTGKEKLNLKAPGGGGMADLEYLETYQSLVFPFAETKSRGALMTVSVSDNHHRLISTGRQNPRAGLGCLGFWRHGAVYRVGRNLEQLGILDLRRIEPST